MTRPNELPFSALQFYGTAPYPCSYLPGLSARSQVATPSHMINADVYSDLVRNGFRRSGLFSYRPYCDGCKACIPVRLLAKKYKPTRGQRRAWNQHKNLKTSVQSLTFEQEHYELYQSYQKHRHSDGGMDEDSREQYTQFLLQSRVNSRLVEFRDEDKVLRMVSIIDILSDGLSSVYTFFDPDIKGSLGTFGIMWQARQCAELGLPYLYLGYWIEASHKMSYKTQFEPIECLQGGQWESVKAYKEQKLLPQDTGNNHIIAAVSPKPKP